ncbi:hypothetical protein EES45_34720 [Streptomyces sp. ADI97-07]|nr:hypothetical protein EES45_34720 [Streptomyces sp. ADI97-07]
MSPYPVSGPEQKKSSRPGHSQEERAFKPADGPVVFSGIGWRAPQVLSALERNGCFLRRGVRAVIPQPADQIGHRLRRGRAGGRPPGFDTETYKERNAVERCIARLKQWRGLAMRTGKLAVAYQAALHLSAILIWSRR